ncbi:hypothetical protein ASPACDRAFT_26755 [Aspergillus aculeatus ATCC 16872]|uniref:Cytochrome P450 n=1 Tax=Aspergillus aculeatus (strain ATCC 16872 / CBS 172.66 / WB 5094) TaxID=690307 RepID=A0A1L9WZN0_ASPA1|nr:uncharacterized protein ASPACDRAFT_26755 [Aspergillus aculeatus ATCC 16872]OJK01623.1 hypothetical protein ASPACDRAFT_26755 [Aspergillus aculeatus ATCC 16872]
MASSFLLLNCTFPALAGLLAHHMLFRRREWHMEGRRLLNITLVMFPVLVIFESREAFRMTSFAHASLIMSSFFLSLFSSMIIYRIFFHRIRQFPGPFLAGVSKLWHSYQCLGGQNHLLLDKLHQEYGDFVRTGPNEITVFHPQALAILDGPRSQTRKSDWYDLLLPYEGVTTIRERALHDQRRRIWNKAFAAPELAHYRRHILSLVLQFDSLVAVAAAEERPVPFSTYAYWFSFDAMGLFALSRSFNMLRNEEWHYSILMMRRAMKLLGPLTPVPWLAQLGFSLLRNYWVVKDWHTMIAWCRQRMQERTRVSKFSFSLKEPDSHDIAQWIIDDARKCSTIYNDERTLTGEAVVAIIAGSDTVAPTLVFLFYELALHPEKAAKLYEELRKEDIADFKTLQRLPYLNAIIKETLRLHPAVPTGGYRDTPADGIVIDGTFIPGDTTLIAPRYSLSRLESCYVNASKWIPERWTTQSELIKDNKSFLPFGQGRYTCLGKELAMSELQLVTASLISNYRLAFPVGWDESRIKKVEDDLRDQFTAAPGQLELLFIRR